MEQIGIFLQIKNKMAIKIGAFGYGLAAIFGAGAVLLAALGNGSWPTFMFIAVILWLISIAVRKIR